MCELAKAAEALPCPPQVSCSFVPLFFRARQSAAQISHLRRLNSELGCLIRSAGADPLSCGFRRRVRGGAARSLKPSIRFSDEQMMRSIVRSSKNSRDLPERSWKGWSSCSRLEFLADFSEFKLGGVIRPEGSHSSKGCLAC